MPRPSSKTPLLVAIIGFALLCLVGLNVMQSKTAPKSEQEMEAEQAKQAAEAAKNAPKTAQAAPLTPGGEQLVALGANATLGPKTAKNEVVVGWEWTPEIQSDPGRFYQNIEEMSKAAPSVRIRVVNRDADPAIPLGLSQSGQVMVSPLPDGTLPPTALQTVQAMNSAPATTPPGPAKKP